MREEVARKVVGRKKVLLMEERVSYIHEQTALVNAQSAEPHLTASGVSSESELLIGQFKKYCVDEVG